MLEVYDELDDVITRFLMFLYLKIQGSAGLRIIQCILTISSRN